MSQFEIGDGSSRRWKAKSKNELPLYYKDKPSGIPRKNWKLKMAIKGIVGGCIIYFIFLLFNNSNYSKSSNKWSIKQQEVKSAFLDSWHTYEKYGWGTDVYSPISQTGKNMGPKPLGWMIVDSIDTLMIMDADDEVSRARKWIKSDLDYLFDYNVNLFETTIRMLGGLLSAHALSKDDLYLDKAADLAKALLGGFKSKTGVPYSSVNLLTGEGIKNHVDNGASSTAEVATLQLEFKYLSLLTGETLYWQAAEKVMEVLEANKPEDGLVPIYVQPDTGKYQGSLIRLGLRGDSYYEYLLKQYLQTSKQEKVYWEMYRESVNGVKKHMVGKSVPNGLTFIGELEQGIKGQMTPKMDHLVCFYGGLLALGATGGLTLKEARKLPDWNSEKESDFKLAEELTFTCYKMYHDTATGLAPEIAMFNQQDASKSDFYIKSNDRHNLQRPETVESLFILYRLTGDEKYRRYGYEIFQSFQKYTKVVNELGEVSYTSLDDVTTIPPKKRDNTESFWWAETLKYLYLLFDDTNKIPLDKYVFNTEAHPFPIFKLTETLKTGWRKTIPESKEPTMQEPQIKIDKLKPPKALPVDKKIDEEANDEIKKNPSIAKDENVEETKEKINKILKNMEVNPN